MHQIVTMIDVDYFPSLNQIKLDILAHYWLLVGCIRMSLSSICIYFHKICHQRRYQKLPIRRLARFYMASLLWTWCSADWFRTVDQLLIQQVLL